MPGALLFSPPPTPTVYGITDVATGLPALDFDTFVEVKFEGKMKVSDFAVEKGSFATYNKVTHAYKAHVQVAVCEGAERRHQFMLTLDKLMKGTQRVNITTEDCTYLNATLEDYTILRSRKTGWGQIIVDLAFVEVREVFAQYANVKLPGANGSKSGGQVDPEVAPDVQGHVGEEDYNRDFNTKLEKQTQGPGGSGKKALQQTTTPPSSTGATQTPAQSSGHVPETTTPSVS